MEYPLTHSLPNWLRYQADRVIGRLAGHKTRYAPLPDPELEHEPQRVPCHPALLEYDQLERVTECGFGRALEHEVTTLCATSYVERPMKIYRIGAATVLGGLIVTRYGRHYFGSQLPSIVSIFRAEYIKGPCLLPNSMQGLHYFGHWLGDDCAAFEAFRNQAGITSMVRPVWNDAPLYQTLFDQNWTERLAFHCDDLTLLSDIGFSRAKANRYRTLRGRMRGALAPSHCSDRIVFIRRGSTAERRDITNWPQLEERLISAGVEIVTPEKNTRNFIQKILDVSIIITVEGSQARHAIYGLREGGALLVLQPPDRFYAAPQEWMRCLDMHCGIVVGTINQNGFRIEPDEVLKMVDRLLEITKNRQEI